MQRVDLVDAENFWRYQLRNNTAVRASEELGKAVVVKVKRPPLEFLIAHKHRKLCAQD
jgi:hypothetical protein